MSCAVLLGLAAPTARALELQIDNQSGKRDSDVYVMLFAAGAFNASFLQNNRVGNPGSIVMGTAACPPVCGTVDSRASASLARAARVRRPRHPRVVARDRTQVGPGQKRELTMGLTRAGRRLLRRSGRLRTRLEVEVTSPTGHRSTANGRLTFRARG